MDMEDVVWIPDDEPNVDFVQEEVPVSTTKWATAAASNQSAVVNLEIMNSSCNSHAVAYNKLIPIGEGLQSFSQLAQFNSTSRVLFMENSSEEVSSGGSSSLKAEIINEPVLPCFDDLVVKSEYIIDDTSSIEALNVVINNKEPVEQHTIDFSQDSCFGDLSDHPSEETLSADENVQFDFKPSPVPYDAAGDTTQNFNTDIPIKNELFSERCIKSECVDEFSNNVDAGEIIIKTEVADFEAHDHEISETACSTETEKFLNRNPDVFTNFCGLSNSTLFNALLDYIADDIEPIKGVTKYEQLFSVLTKLHKNEGHLYLNKFIFPSAYVSIVELLHRKLDVLCKDSSDCTSLPAILTPEFDCTQNVVIFGVLTLRVRSESFNFPDGLRLIKYLIAYSAFGEVFFVSAAFIGVTDILKLIYRCGVLRKLAHDDWILLYIGERLHVTQVNKFYSKKRYRDKFSQMNSTKVQRHTQCILNRLTDHFAALGEALPECMLQKGQGSCFIDKLVFVCCMLLNMLPRCTYE